MSTSSLPTKTDVLIVGAGPIGTTVAITLLRNGAKDITIVDGSPEPSKIGSRAVVVHSRTLEVRFSSRSILELPLTQDVTFMLAGSETYGHNRRAS